MSEEQAGISVSETLAVLAFMVRSGLFIGPNEEPTTGWKSHGRRCLIMNIQS